MPKYIKVFFLLMLLSLMGLAAFFFWPNSKEKQQAWTPQNLEPFKHWYQINWQQQVIGWASLELKKETQQIRIIEQDFITGRVQFEQMEFSFRRELVFDNKKPYKLISVNIDSKEPNLKVSKRITNDVNLTATEDRNGKRKSYQQETVDYNLLDYLSVYNWLEHSKPDKILLTKEFNNDDYGIHYSRYELMESPSTTNLYFKVKHQLQNSDDINDSYQSQATWLDFSKDIKLIKRLKANGMSFVASEGKVTVDTVMQKDLYINAGISVDRPLGRTDLLQELELEFPIGFQSKISNHPALKLQSNKLLLRKGYRYLAAEVPQASTAHPRATNLAKILVRDLQSDEQQIKALLEYVNQQLNYQTLPASFEIDDILDNKIGDCTEHALLLSEMLNGVGIPARQVSGLVYLGDDKKRFGGHVWVEVFENGYWRAVDPSWNLFEVTATHIPLIIGADKTPEILQNSSDFKFRLINKK